MNALPGLEDRGTALVAAIEADYAGPKAPRISEDAVPSSPGSGT